MVEGLHGVTDSRRGKAVQQGLYLSPAQHTGAGDYQYIVDILLLEEAAQFFDFSRPLQICGHPIAHKVVADFQNSLKGSAPDDL